MTMVGAFSLFSLGGTSSLTGTAPEEGTPPSPKKKEEKTVFFVFLNILFSQPLFGSSQKTTSVQDHNGQ
jgi:hypothetical protein